MDALYTEVASLARHLHWSYDEIMRLEHHERQRWLAEIRKAVGQ